MNRRSVLKELLIVASLVGLPANEASAILFSGATISAASGQVTTLTMNNASGASETPMWSKVFGLCFPDSDTTGLPLSGGNPTYPVFKIGSTTYSYSMSKAPTFYASGRLMHATFCILYGTGVTLANNASASVTVNQGGGTSRPANSSRSLADFATADPKHLVTFLDNGTGNYSASLTDGIADALPDNYEWLDGAAGRMWCIRCRYKKAGTPEGNLEAYVYCMSMQDNSGNFGGARFNWCLATPFGDASPIAVRDWKSFSAMTLQTGATVIRNNVTSGRTNTYNFTWSSGINLDTSANVLEAGTLCRLTTTGTLPTGLSTGTSYWIDNGVNVYAPPQFNFQLTTNGPYDTFATPSSAGSGTHTVTVYPWITAGARIFMLDTDGEWDFVQGGGSFTPPNTYRDTKVQTKFDRVYLRSTKLIGSYDFTPTLSSATATSFFINTCARLSNAPNAGGVNDEHIGLLPGYYVRHLYNQSQQDETNVLAIGYSSGLTGGTIRMLANNGTFPAWNNGTGGTGTPYSGMGTLLWNQPQTFFTFNSSIARNTMLANGPGNYSHYTAYTYYPYLITGRPEFLDMHLEQHAFGSGGGYAGGVGIVGARIASDKFAPRGIASLDGSNQGDRNVTVGGVTRYNVNMWSGQGRDDGWRLRDWACAAFICPQNHPQCAAYKTLFVDMVTDTIDFTYDCCQAMWAINSYCQSNGLAFTQGGAWNDPWQNAMIGGALGLYYGVTGYSKALTLMNSLNNFTAYCINTFGLYGLEFFQLKCRPNDSFGGFGNLATQLTDLGNAVEGCLSWTSGTPNFTLDVTASQIIPLVGDMISFPDFDIVSTISFQPPPAAFTQNTPYYIHSISGSGSTRTITLSATAGGGGSAISNTDASTFAHSMMFLPMTPTTSIVGDNSSTSTPTQVGRFALMMKSRGATFDATAEATMLGAGGIPAATTGNFNGQNPAWCFGKVA